MTNLSKLGEYDWYDGNSGGVTHPVGRKRPNAFGLYDMHGNVCQWCWDSYDEAYYARSPMDDPPGASEAVPPGVPGRVLEPRPARLPPLLPVGVPPQELAGARLNDVGFRLALSQSGR